MKKKYKRAGTTSERQDYRTGGRVGYQKGKNVNIAGRGGRIIPQEPQGDFNVPQSDLDAAEEARDKLAEENAKAADKTIDQAAEPTTTSVGNTEGTASQIRTINEDNNLKTTATPERAKRIQQSAEQLEKVSTGDLTDEEKRKRGLLIEVPEEGKMDASIEGKTTEIAEQDKVEFTDADTALETQLVKADETRAVDESTGQNLKVSDKFKTAAQVSEEVDIEEAQGVVSDKAELTNDEIAQAANVADVTPIEGAKIDIPEGALQERVVGSISEGAKASAAKVAGTTLRKVTRAKTQLRNAGLTEEQINDLGNDPEDLEERLMEFSEEERGIIAGLPKQALVSSQLDTLLSGIENGEIPAWAQPAVTQVEEMLAARGLSASSVGRAQLTNAIIQSAIPIAQSNATTVANAFSQQRSIEAQAAIKDAEFKQQTAVFNAGNVFAMDMAQFNADQQRAVNNSKFLQTVGLTEASNDQQATVQNAVIESNINLAEADAITRLTSQNAKAFLQMDVANLSNSQQARIVETQQEQQRILSNQSATNAAAQFNAASENQVNQFMASMSFDMQRFNVSQQNAMNQFNVTQANAQIARNADRQQDINKFNKQLETQVDEFNAQVDFNRQQWNAANQAAVQAADVEWRRKVNTADTAAINAANMQSAMNQFNMSSTALAFLGQELRDQADFDFRAFENKENRNAQIMATLLGNSGDAGKYAYQAAEDGLLDNLLRGDAIGKRSNRRIPPGS